MNADQLTSDLKKNRTSNESFWLIGQPDATLEKLIDGEDKGKNRVSVQGFDYYNTKTGNLESGGSERIVLWMLNPDYDGQSVCTTGFLSDGYYDGWLDEACKEPQGRD